MSKKESFALTFFRFALMSASGMVLVRNDDMASEMMVKTRRKKNKAPKMSCCRRSFIGTLTQATRPSPLGMPLWALAVGPLRR